MYLIAWLYFTCFPQPGYHLYVSCRVELTPLKNVKDKIDRTHQSFYAISFLKGEHLEKIYTYGSK